MKLARKNRLLEYLIIYFRYRSVTFLAFLCIIVQTVYNVSREYDLLKSFN